ncbi:hypothetical protein PGSY75_1367300 [Plasmodium gaboni]|uniref:Uncharacterized protein n=1 Tax=Plasmodium gaboni TaxID=647221 RepID=A0A151LER4_9APIC|nr:hypothetical protein PGSY75_1367300 [Plasmodium gaboni]KYN97428.1 hypothetical protein PGSY75_1367300 [Plasmodium gaboni]
MYRFILYVAIFLHIFNFLLRMDHMYSCTTITNDYVSELFDMELFDSKEKNKIKNEIYDIINETHKTYAWCKTCIKIIQLIYQIIKEEKKKEKYIDIIIEDILEINLCNQHLWNKYFIYNISLLYTEFFLDNCKYTLNIIKDNIEKYIYISYNDQNALYQYICLPINPICKTAIIEEQNNFNHNINIQTVFSMYSQYLLLNENFIITTKGLPYKIIENKINKEIKVKQNSYIIIQSKIKIIHAKILQDDFSYERYRLIKVSKLEEKIQELFLKMSEGHLFVFFFYIEYHHKGDIIPNNSILDIKIKIHKVKDHIEDMDVEKIKNKLIYDIDGFLLYP